jgi:hypothetical protein
MPMWLLGSTSMLNRALVPPRGFELVVTPLLHLPEVCSRTTMWLQIYGMAPWLRLPSRHVALGPCWQTGPTSPLRGS